MSPPTNQEDPIFTLAIVADTHMRPEAGDLSSPWEVNKLANGRARYVVEMVNRSRSSFTIHLGDIVHPVPILPSYGPAAEAVLTPFEELKEHVHFIPGNHDVGDKPLAGLAAPCVSEDGIQLYEKYFGSPYASFDFKGCHFVLINAQVINSDLPSEHEQRIWLEPDLKKNSGKRIFIFTHYPPYLMEPEEPSHYDNLDAPGRAWFLNLLCCFQVEALFAGHVHQFFYNRYEETECYLIPATSFVRQDFSEMFRVEPAPEFGRDDGGKLGFVLVDIFADRHVVRFIRTLGETKAIDSDLPAAILQAKTCHTRNCAFAPVGFHLRHPWAEVTTLPFNGPVDEFRRKKARNDYPLLALWDMGVKKLRVPLSDLIETDTRERMHALVRVGHEFTVFIFGAPDDATIATLVRHQQLLHRLEIIVDWKDIPETLMALAILKPAVSFQINLSKQESSAQKSIDGSRFNHLVSYGFGLSDFDEITDLLAVNKNVKIIDSFVFTVPWRQSPWSDIPLIEAFVNRHHVGAVVNIRIASDNPAEHINDDLSIANLIAETMVVAFASNKIDIFVDTFVDIDRGFFPRHGVFDRRYNPRLAGEVYKYLQGILSHYEEQVTLERSISNDCVKELIFSLGGKASRRILPVSSDIPSNPNILEGVADDAVAESWIDLRSGEYRLTNAKAQEVRQEWFKETSPQGMSPSLVILG